MRAVAQHLLAPDAQTRVINLVARCVPQSRGNLEVNIGRLLPIDGHQHLQPDETAVRCFVRHVGDSCSDDDHFCQTGVLSVEHMQIVTESRDLRVDAAGPLNLGAFLAWAASLVVDVKERRIFLQLCANYPLLSFKLALLAMPLRTHETPLLSQLLDPQRHTNMGYGFLTLDLGRRAVCLLETDELVQRTPVVGVWVDLLHCLGGHGFNGLDSLNGLPEPGSHKVAAAWWDAAEVIDHPLVWTAAARYVHNSHLKERVWVDEATFLVMVVHSSAAPAQHAGGDFHSRENICLSFFESRYEEQDAHAAYLSPADEAAAFDADASSEAAAEGWCNLSVRSVSLAAAAWSNRSENPEEDVPPRGPSRSGHVQPSRSDFFKFAHAMPPASLTSSLELPRTAAPRPHPGLGRREEREQAAQAMATLEAVPSESQSPLAPHMAAPRQWQRPQAPLPEDVPGLSGFGRHCRVRGDSAAANRAVEPERAGIAEVDASWQQFPLRPAPAKQDSDGAALLRLVGLQQAELSEMKQQISSLHALVSRLVGTSPQAGSPVAWAASTRDVAVNVGESLVLKNSPRLPGPIETERSGIPARYASVATSTDLQALPESTASPTRDSHLALTHMALGKTTELTELTLAPQTLASAEVLSSSVGSSHPSEFLMMKMQELDADGTAIAAGSSMASYLHKLPESSARPGAPRSAPSTMPSVVPLEHGALSAGAGLGRRVPAGAAGGAFVGMAFPDDIPRIICPSSPSLSSSEDMSLDDDFDLSGLHGFENSEPSIVLGIGSM